MVTALEGEINADSPESRIATALFLVAMIAIGALVARKWQRDIPTKDRIMHLLIMLVVTLAVSIFAR